MNRSQRLVQAIQEATDRKEYVHKDHAAALHKRLKESKIKHKKDNHISTVYGFPCYGFSFRPEAFGGFSSCCHDVGQTSTSNAPVCVTAGSSCSGGASAGGSGGAGPSASP